MSRDILLVLRVFCQLTVEPAIADLQLQAPQGQVLISHTTHANFHTSTSTIYFLRFGETLATNEDFALNYH